MDRLRRLSRTAGLPVETLALRWAFARPVDCFLVGARSPRHIDQAVEAWQARGTPAELLAEFP